MGDYIVAAIAAEIAFIVLVCAVVFGGVGWAVGHFLF